MQVKSFGKNSSFSCFLGESPWEATTSLNSMIVSMMHVNSTVLRAAGRGAACHRWLRLSCCSSYSLSSFMRVNGFASIKGRKVSLWEQISPFVTVLYSLVGDFIFWYQSSHFGLAKAFPWLIYSDINEGGLHPSDLVFFHLGSFRPG